MPINLNVTFACDKTPELKNGDKVIVFIGSKEPHIAFHYEPEVKKKEEE